MKTTSTTREVIESYLNEILQISQFKDYCPNGLQVQGKASIKKVVTGVTCSLALIERAIMERADAILVHHGWFWKNDDPRVVGQLYARMKLLMEHDINLLAYHLPLDQHAKFGNNVQLAKTLGLKIEGQSKTNPMVWYGSLGGKNKETSLGKFASHTEKVLSRTPMVIGDLKKPVARVAWCTGGAQGYISDAATLGADVYISGEISEQTTHAARELGIAYISAGHHATEKYGIQALGNQLAKEFNIKHVFIDIPNPV
jgi:dinuclear metal center YbgI/SA1388 family protein